MMLMAGLNVLSFNGWCQHFTPEGALFFGMYPLAITHGLLENLPFGSMIFPAISI